MTRYLRARLVADRAVAAVVLAVCSPVIAVLGWLVRRHDGGPMLIGVTRMGAGGVPFKMWKLRSMRPDHADGRAGGAGLTTAGDSRVTPIGKTLRAFHLDELPQLLNVVRGEMALLGPRPEAPEYVDLTDDGWQAVLEAPPGIAGPTQIAVGHWETEVITAAPDGSAYLHEVVPVKVAIDRWYIEHASARLDALVLGGLVRHLAGRPAVRLLRRVRFEVPVADRALPGRVGPTSCVGTQSGEKALRP